MSFRTSTCDQSTASSLLKREPPDYAVLIKVSTLSSSSLKGGELSYPLSCYCWYFAQELLIWTKTLEVRWFTPEPWDVRFDFERTYGAQCVKWSPFLSYSGCKNSRISKWTSGAPISCVYAAEKQEQEKAKLIEMLSRLSSVIIELIWIELWYKFKFKSKDLNLIQIQS